MREEEGAERKKRWRRNGNDGQEKVRSSESRIVSVDSRDESSPVKWSMVKSRGSRECCM